MNCTLVEGHKSRPAENILQQDNTIILQLIMIISWIWYDMITLWIDTATEILNTIWLYYITANNII